MPPVHPNIELISKLDIRDLESCAGLFSDDFVWHYVNPNLPELEGDFIGVDGLKTFFGTLAGTTGGSFEATPVSATPIGDEFIVVHVRDTMMLAGRPIALDAVVLWRVAEGKLCEAWDIPSAHHIES